MSLQWRHNERDAVSNHQRLHCLLNHLCGHESKKAFPRLLKRGNFLPLSVHRIRCLGIEVYKCYRGLNPDYLNNLFKQSSTNTTWEIRVVLSSPNLTLSHMGSVSFDTMVLSFGTFCHIQWKIQKTLTYSKVISRDGATVNSVICLMCFEITRGFLSAFILFAILFH